MNKLEFIRELIANIDIITVFDSDTKTVKEIKDITLNGHSIQLNTEEWEE